MKKVLDKQLSSWYNYWGCDWTFKKLDSIE